MRTRRPATAALVALTVCALFAVAAPALARAVFGAHAREKLPPRVGALLPSRASEKATLRTTWGKRATVWVSPTSNQWSCAYLKIDDPRAPSSFGTNGGGVCRPTNRPDPLPISVQLGWFAAGSDFGVTVMGRVSSTSGVTAIALRSSTAERSLSLVDGYFVGELPRSDSMGTLSRDGEPFVIVGYGHSGAEIAQTNLTSLVNDVAGN